MDYQWFQRFKITSKAPLGAFPFLLLKDGKEIVDISVRRATAGLFQGSKGLFQGFARL